MSQDNPFNQLFHLFGKTPENHVQSINAEAFDKMLALLSRPVEAAGKCILLRAPRAGYGKTHLLSGVQSRLAATHEFVLLQPADGFRIDAAATLADVAARLTRNLPGGAGLTGLDVLARRVFSLGLEPLVRSGEVPCQDRDAALSSLRNRAVETFDFNHPTAVTAHWARDNFEILGPRLVVEISQLLNAPLREVSFWVDALFRYAVTPLDQPGRAGMFMATALDAPANVMMERLSTLLRLLSQTERVVLVADELEGMSANEEAALRLAAFVTALRHGAERVDFVISVNDDVWENAFLPRLSGGLQDRLSEAVVRLEPLKGQQVKELLAARHPEAVNLLDRIKQSGDLYARGLLVQVASLWDSRNDEPSTMIASLETTTAAAISQTSDTVVSPMTPDVVVAQQGAIEETRADETICTAPAETQETIPQSVQDEVIEEVPTTFSTVPNEPEEEVATPSPFSPFQPQPSPVVFSSEEKSEPLAVTNQDAPLSNNTVAVPWKASDIASLATVADEPVTVPEKPVFVAPVIPAVEESVSNSEDQQEASPVPAVTPSPFAAIAENESNAPATNGWWEDRRSAFAAAVSEIQPTIDQSTSFGDPTSPFIAAEPTEVAEIKETVIEEVSVPAAPTYAETAPFQRVDPPAPAFSPAPYQSVAAPTYGSQTGSPFSTLQATTFTPETPTVAPTPYGSPASTFSPEPVPTTSLTEEAEEAQNREIDRVDDLLRQFRERYGRS